MRGDRGRPIIGGGRFAWLRHVTRHGREERRELLRLRDDWRARHDEHQRAYSEQQER